MIKKICIIILGVFLNFSVFAQGINFENTNWKTISAKAKKQKKIINLNICSSWSKPCATISAIYKNDSVGDFYNKNFINVNIDIESEEGQSIIKSYPAAVFPIQTFIHPINGAVIYVEYGEATANDYIKRGTVALEEFKQNLSYTSLLEQYQKGNRDPEFLQSLLDYGHKLNKNNDAIISEYVTLFFKNNPSEKDIELLHKYITTIDNLGTIYIYNLASATKDEKFSTEVNNWIADLFTGTYIKAVNTKNPQLIDKIKSMASKIDHPQVEPIYYYYLQQYYKAINDEPKYLDAIKNEMDYYLSKPIVSYKQEDSLALIQVRKEYQSQLKMYGIAEDQMEAYIQQNIKGNPQAINSISYMAADQINNTIDLVLQDSKKFKSLLPMLEQWGDKMMELMNGYDNYLAYLSINQAKVLLQNNKEQQAKSLLVTALKAAKDNAALTDKIEKLYNSIQ